MAIKKLLPLFSIYAYQISQHTQHDRMDYLLKDLTKQFSSSDFFSFYSGQERQRPTPV